jgi:hypothetical protein
MLESILGKNQIQFLIDETLKKRCIFSYEKNSKKKRTVNEEGQNAIASKLCYQFNQDSFDDFMKNEAFNLSF